jgi:molybdopterin converting factor small subunit
MRSYYLRILKKKKEWYDDECKEATEKKNKSYRDMIQKRCTRNAVEKYQEMRRQEKHIRKAKKRSYTEELLKEIDSLNSQDESRKFYQLINNLRQDFKPRITAFRNTSGEIINGMNDVLNRWKQHFKELFSEGDEVSGNMEPNPLSRRATDSEVENEAPTKEEVN